jgi:hypothetical protein
MRPATLPAVLFVHTNSSTTLAATKPIKFGRVATSYPPVPSGAEVIELADDQTGMYAESTVLRETTRLYETAIFVGGLK